MIGDRTGKPLLIVLGKVSSDGSDKPIEPKTLAQHFRDGGKGTRRVERGLRLLAAAGVVRRSDAGWFLPADR